MDRRIFNELLYKKECSEYEYKIYKQLFDEAVNSGVISSPQKYEKIKITSGAGTSIEYAYKWIIKED